jgi:hypothetical protein
MLATCPNFVISVENAFLVIELILERSIDGVKRRNRFSVYICLAWFLIAQRVHGGVVNHITAPMNVKPTAFDAYVAPVGWNASA